MWARIFGSFEWTSKFEVFINALFIGALIEWLVQPVPYLELFISYINT